MEEVEVMTGVICGRVRGQLSTRYLLLQQPLVSLCWCVPWCTVELSSIGWKGGVWYGEARSGMVW